MNDNANDRRRSLLKGMALLVSAAVVPASKPAFSAQKVSQASVQYQDKPKGDQQCSNCVHFEAPNSCKIVEGPVSANGWCAVWSKKA